MFLKVPEGFQQKKFSSCADTLLLPITIDIKTLLDLAIKALPSLLVILNSYLCIVGKRVLPSVKSHQSADIVKIEEP